MNFYSAIDIVRGLGRVINLSCLSAEARPVVCCGLGHSAAPCLFERTRTKKVKSAGFEVYKESEAAGGPKMTHTHSRIFAHTHARGLNEI